MAAVGKRSAPVVKTRAMADEATQRWAQVIGRNFRTARLKAGLTIADAAFVQKFATFFLWSVENGRANLSVESLVFLADLIGEDVAGLVKSAGTSKARGLRPTWKRPAAARSRERASPLGSLDRRPSAPASLRQVRL